MSVSVRFTRGPLMPRALDGAGEGVGARVVFEGIVRRMEGERAIEALEYDVYRRMAERMMVELATELVVKHGLLRVDVEHSDGRVPVGACSFLLVVDAPHRKEALAAADEFIDRMKRDVPIWKGSRATCGGEIG